MCMALIIFSGICNTAAYSHLHKYHMLGLHITDECLVQFFVCFPILLRMKMNKWDGFSISLNNLSVILTHWHIGSVTTC